jgi:tetratricopeptide (TPR) repeat protein
MCSLLGRYQQASTYGESAYHLFRKYHDRTGEARALDTLGYNAHQAGQHAQALTYFNQALALRRNVGNSYGEAETLRRLGEFLADNGAHSQAREVWHRALDLYRQQRHDNNAQSIRQQIDHLDHLTD